MGVDHITYHPPSGRPRNVAPEAVREEILPVADDLSIAGEHHWTPVKLCGWLRDYRGLDLPYPTLVR